MKPTAVSWCLAATASLALIALFGLEVADLDVWFHLAIGRDILAARAVPSVDHWTVLGQGRPYHDSQWLFQAAITVAHHVGGMTAVQLLGMLAWTVCFAALWRLARRGLSVDAASVLILMVGLSSFERFMPRPEVVTYAALAWTLLWLEEGRGASAADFVRFAVLQGLWTNSHGLFVLGPFAAGCYFLPVARGRGRPTTSAAAAALAATLVGSLVSPFGFRGWQYALLLFRESVHGVSGLVGGVGELSSPFGPMARLSPATWAFSLLLAAAVAAGASALRRGEVSGRLLVAATLAALALTGRRNVALFAAGAVPLLASEAARWLPARRLGTAWIRAATASLALTAAWAAWSGWLALHLEIPARWGLGATPSFFPHGWPAVLKRTRFSGGVLASNTLGGFVAFHGAPRVLPLTDGRWEIYDPDALRGVLAATRTRGAWRTVVSRYRLGAILLAHTSPEAAALLPDLATAPDWRLVYYDAAASFWLPQGTFAAAGTVDPRDAATLPATLRTEDAILLATFLSRVGARSTEIEVLRRGLDLGGREAWFLERLGMAELAEDRRAEGEAAFRRLLAIEPRSEAALNELAFLAYARGDLDSAIALLTDLVRIAPADAGYRQNLERVQTARRARSGSADRLAR